MLILSKKHNGMNNTAEQDLALQKERMALLIHHVDCRDQFTFVLSLASLHAYFRAVLCGTPSSVLFFSLRTQLNLLVFTTQHKEAEIATKI